MRNTNICTAKIPEQNIVVKSSFSGQIRTNQLISNQVVNFYPLVLTTIKKLEIAKARGARIGRQRIPPFTVQKVIELKERGLTYKEIIKQVKISKSAYYEIVKTAK